MNELMNRTARQAKRLIIGTIGFTVVLIGVAMIVLPGPAILVIPAGLGILATEFVWARRLLKAVKSKFQEATAKGTSSPGRKDTNIY
jgi:uncharacterized protein (TIGR02611 family)